MVVPPRNRIAGRGAIFLSHRGRPAVEVGAVLLGAAVNDAVAGWMQGRRRTLMHLESIVEASARRVWGTGEGWYPHHRPAEVIPSDPLDIETLDAWRRVPPVERSALLEEVLGVLAEETTAERPLVRDRRRSPAMRLLRHAMWRIAHEPEEIFGSA